MIDLLWPHSSMLQYFKLSMTEKKKSPTIKTINFHNINNNNGNASTSQAVTINKNNTYQQLLFSSSAELSKRIFGFSLTQKMHF